MDRRTLLAITLSFLVFVGWQKFYIEPRLPKNAPVTQDAREAHRETPAATASASGKNTPQAKPQEHQFTTSSGVLTVSNGPRALKQWTTNGYPIDLQKVSQQEEGTLEIAFDSPELSYANALMAPMETRPDGAVWSYEDEKLALKKTFTAVPGKPYVDVALEAKFKQASPKYAFVSLLANSPEGDTEKADRSLVSYTEEKISRVRVADVKPVYEIPTELRWIGVTSRYFLLAAIPQEKAPKGLLQQIPPHGGRISMVYPIQGDTMRIPLRVYFGPKELNTLRSVDPTLEHTVDFGMFTVLAFPILVVMKWLHGAFGNWGVAIILLTIFIKILTFPLTYWGMRSMRKMAVLQPQLNAIREKHKDDREALNREMLNVMRTHGYNPLAGCVPILIQMPVFFALYRVLYSSIELYGAPFGLWIHDLSLKDPFYVTPVVLTGVMWLQQKLTPATVTDPVQAKMMQFMPIMFGLMMLTLPSGLTLYMLVNALTSIAQQMVLNRHFPKPAATPVTV